MPYNKIEDAQIETPLNVYLKKVGYKIKEKRRELNLSQVDLAFMTNISPSSIFYIESGLNNFTIKSIYKISLAISVDIDDLLSP